MFILKTCSNQIKYANQYKIIIVFINKTIITDIKMFFVSKVYAFVWIIHV